MLYAPQTHKHDATLPTDELCHEPVGLTSVNINVEGSKGQAVAAPVRFLVYRGPHIP